MNIKTIIYLAISALLFTVCYTAVLYEGPAFLDNVNGDTELLLDDGSTIKVIDLRANVKSIDSGSTAEIRIPKDRIVQVVDESSESHSDSSDPILYIHRIFSEKTKSIPSKVVLKDFDLEDAPKHRVLAEAQKEFNAMVLASRRGYIPEPYYLLCGTVKKKPLVGIVMENIQGNTISELHKDQLLDEVTLRSYAYQLLSALAYLHSIELAHCDVKPDNVMITPLGRLVLLDLGLVLKLNRDQISFQKAVGTPQYWAPELMVFSVLNVKGSKPPRFSKDTIKMFDIFAAGMTLLSAYLGTNPFKDARVHAEFIEISAILIAELSLEEHRLSIGARRFLISCIHFNHAIVSAAIREKPVLNDELMVSIYAGRKSALELLEDPWIAGHRAHVPEYDPEDASTSDSGYRSNEHVVPDLVGTSDI